MRDRLYGQIELPPLAGKLATTCPLVLRLREVRMANIPFLTHPSFANVDRYEHSVGVAHLAWRWARENRIPMRDSEALTIAALYHDAATPAYGHLFEELLAWRYDFDHEATLLALVEGRSSAAVGGRNAQVFAGAACRISRVLSENSTEGAPSVFDVADILAGKSYLSPLIKGAVDLDNIDNVVRASTAMGLYCREATTATEMASALTLLDGHLAVHADRSAVLVGWQRMRRRLYSAILDNALEFRAQSAMKWAIEIWLDKTRASEGPRLWRYTDPELTFRMLPESPESEDLVNRTRRGTPPRLLFSAWFKDITPLLGAAGLPRVQALRALLAESTRRDPAQIYLNYYVDKRVREVELPVVGELPLFRTEPPILRQPRRSGQVAGILGAITTSMPAKVALPDSRDFASMVVSAVGVAPSRVAPAGWVFSPDTVDS